MNAFENMMLDMADTITTTLEAMNLAQSAYLAEQANRISKNVLGFVLGACADCADDNGDINEYFLYCAKVQEAIGYKK